MKKEKVVTVGSEFVNKTKLSREQFNPKKKRKQGNTLRKKQNKKNYISGNFRNEP